MIMKYVDYKWTKERKDAFTKIREAIAEAPTLQSPTFKNNFILYTFAFDHLIVVVLTQKNEVGEEFPVSFMSMGFQGVELNYPALDKQAFAAFKTVKNLQSYILKSRTKVIVPHLFVISLLI